MDTARYLQRIGFDGSIQHRVATLELLQRAHMTAVPFENLHVFHRRGVRTDAAWSVPKVLDGRGGWCFELNGAFAWLLRQLEFRVEYLQAQVFDDDELGAPFDHMLLRVEAGGAFLADVGFGDSFLSPLRFDERGEQHDATGSYRLAPAGPGRSPSPGWRGRR